MEGKIKLLGTGASLGVPVIGCACETCKSKNFKDKRLRSGSLIEWEGKKILLDAGPDFREQALTHKVEQLDGFILTHAHYDHMGGFDDLRVYKLLKGNKLPCLMLDETFSVLLRGSGYLFNKEQSTSNLFTVETVPVGKGVYDFLGLEISYFTYTQMGMPVMGIKIGSLAYVSDIKEYDEALIEELKGVKTLIVSALRYTSSPMHFSVEEALVFIEKVKPQKAYLTHIAHEITHDLLQKELPKDVEIAYDGLSLMF